MIPKSFKLIDDTYLVKYKSDLNYENDATGLIKFDENIIYIQPNEKSSPRLQHKIEKSFYHELIHAILYKMRQLELNDDERFVDLFATLLHQYEITKKI